MSENYIFERGLVFKCHIRWAILGFSDNCGSDGLESGRVYDPCHPLLSAKDSKGMAPAMDATDSGQ
jgi:hypothetical protein